MISPVIFNSQKSDYERPPIILGQPRGLFDTINQPYPEQTKLYEQLRIQDWTEKEFKFELCKAEFITVDPRISNKMIRNVAFQWETDSTAASTIGGIMACVCSSSSIFVGYQRISDNESIHALTYSEIVKMSFSDNAHAALEKFKNQIDSLERLEVVAAVFEAAFVAAHRWALWQAKPHLYPLTERERYETYDAMFMYVVALLVMERVQFTSSFADTFAICKENHFLPIGDAVQRICVDEMEVHVPFGKANIRAMLETDRGREAYKNNLPLIIRLLNESVQSEKRWIELGAEDNYDLRFAPPAKQWEFARFGGTDVAVFLEVQDKVSFPLVKVNPLPWMSERVNLAAIQGSPQEVPNTQYAVNVVHDDSKGEELPFEM